MDLVKIGFQINATGIKDANVEVDKLLTKVTRVSSKPINLKVKLDNSIQTVKKTLSDVEKIKNNLNTLNIKVSVVGYSQVKASLEKLEALKKSVRDIQVRFTTVGNVNKIRDDFLKLKNKIITVKVVTSTAQLDNLKKKLDSIRDKTVKLNINLPKSSEVEKLGKALDKLTSKKVKIEVTITPDLTTVKEYANALDRIRSSRTTTTTNLGGGAGGSGGRSPAGAFDQVIGIAKYALLSTAIYGVITAVKSLAVAFVTMADEYTSIQNRMKLYINDSQTLATVNRNLGKMSMENNVGLRETATLYTRLAPALQKIGGNAATVTAVVDAFGKSMRIGGATAMEAASATIQFSQAMASGKLAGDEFRSISEASPRFLKAIADGSGIATESLKKLSSEGFLTTSLVARALLKEYPTLIEENKKLGVTLEQGGNAFKTAFIMAVGELNEGAKVTETIGNALMDVAKNLSEFAQTARQTGVEAKASFEKYLPVIQAVGNVLEFVAIVAITKFAASMIVAGATAGAAMVKTTVQIAGLVRTLGVANAAAFALSVTMARLGGGGLATLALTIAGVAASYLLLRDNAAQATSKIAEQSEYVDLTTEAYKKLNSEQQKNAKSSLTEDMNKTNDELDAQADAVNRVLLSYAQFKQMQGKALNKETSDVINQTVRGLISYDTAYRKLIDLGVPKNVVEDFKKQKDVYDEAAKAGLKTEAAARAAGLGIKLSGNEAQNATPAVQGLKDGVDGLAAASLNTADSFAKMVEGFKTGVADIKTTLKVMQSYDLDKGIAQQLIKESQAIAKQTPEIVDAYSKIKKAQELELNSLGDKPDKKRVEAINKRYSGLMKVVEGHEKRLTNEWVKLGAPSAKELQDWTDKESKFISDQRKKDKPPKKSDVNNFPEQLTLAQEYVSLLNQGVDLDVAKIATTKEYVKWYGTNLDMAKSLVAIDKQRAEIEKQRQEQEQKREAKKQGYKTVIDDLNAMKNKSKFIAEGFLPNVAEKSASLGFTPDPAGIQYAQKATTLELEKQADAYRNSAIEKRNILELTKSGRTVEEAQIDNLLYTNKHLLPEQLVLLEQIQDLQKKDRRADTLQKVANDSNTMLRQAAVYSSMQNNDLGDIANSYDMINKSEVQHVNSWKDIVQKVKEYNDYLVNQKANPLGDFSAIDFSVFGDFGNPFESALSGLNLLLGGADSLKEKYDQNFAALDQQAKEAAGNEGTLARIKLTRATLEKKQIVDQKNLQQQQVTAALKGVKTLFSEESKAYKTIGKLEQAYQAGVIAFKLWNQRATIKETALEVASHIKTAASFVTATATKVAAEGGLNIVKGIGAILSAAQQAGPLAFVGFAAMATLVAGLGVSLAGGGLGSNSSGSYDSFNNNGTGTVFGDKEAQSESIKKSIDLLADNSALMLPINNAMLRALKNIESALGGVANLIIRGDIGNSLASGLEFDSKFTGTIGKIDSSINKVEGFVDKISVGKLLGFNIREVVSGIGATIVGGLFGKTSQSVTGSGLFAGSQSLGSVLDTGLNLQQYADVATTKKSWFSKNTSYSTQYGEVDQEIKNQFGLIFDGVFNSILTASSALGKDGNEVTQALRNSIINIGKIDTMGLSGEEIQKKLEAVISAQADNLAKNAVKGLDAFQKIGEGYFETLTRVATGIEQAAYYTDKLGYIAINYTDIIAKQGDVASEIIRQSVLLNESTKSIKGGFYDMVNQFDGTAEELYSFIIELRDLQDQLFMTGKDTKYLTTAMVLGAGGLDVLSSGLDAYFEMLSPAEQAAELTRRLTNEFSIFGKQLPSDVKAFRNLVNSIDITSEAGQKLYGQIIALAPEFNDLQDSLDKANSEVNALVKSLRDLAEEARKARGETEQPRNLAYTRSQFEQASVLAMQGDIASAEKLLTLGKDLMGLSKTYSVTGSEYARDLALIQRAATVAADIQEKGLGTSQTTNLTLPTTTPVTPTVNTTTSSTDARLDALSEKLEAGLFAIAKYTQDSASRLERWDDGNRVMVGIQPENGDTPVPVVVTP